jgi:hypothetical protein
VREIQAAALGGPGDVVTVFGSLEFGEEASPLRLVLADQGAESMSGTFDERGRKGSYLLKSLGGGKYQVEVTIATGDGKVAEKAVKEGTLDELRKEFAFLRTDGVFMLGVPAAPRLALETGEAGFRGFLPGHGETKRVGLVVQSVPEPLAHHLVLVSGEGLMVEQVLPGSRAEQLGLRRLDVLLALDGERIESAAQLKKLHEPKGVLEYVRRGERKRLELTPPPSGGEK